MHRESGEVFKMNSHHVPFLYSIFFPSVCTLCVGFPWFSRTPDYVPGVPLTKPSTHVCELRSKMNDFSIHSELILSTISHTKTYYTIPSLRLNSLNFFPTLELWLNVPPSLPRPVDTKSHKDVLIFNVHTNQSPSPHYDTPWKSLGGNVDTETLWITLQGLP